VDAAKKMEQENRSFTSKMFQRIGDFVNGNRKNSIAQGSDTAEKGSVTTDSTSGEGIIYCHYTFIAIDTDNIIVVGILDYFHESEFATPAKNSSLSRSFSGSVMSLFRSAKSPHSSSFSTRKQSSFSIHRSGERDVTASKPKESSSVHFSDPLEPSLLYHFPLTGQEPPSELCDFCMPAGCRLRHIEDDVTLNDVFYGQKQSTRNGRSFTFLLENRTVPQSQMSDNESGGASLEGGHAAEESGTVSGRLYGFCVIHSRYLNVSGYGSAAAGEIAAPASYDFESPVCYAFISKFPFHDFFFNVIYDIINTERILRMDMMDTSELLPYDTDVKIGTGANNKSTSHSSAREIDRQTYVYLQRSLLEEVLGKVLILPVPKFGDTLKFNVSNYLSQPLSFTRQVPPLAIGEHSLSSSQWALPVLLSWMPYEALVWAIGLILCEAKMIIVGSEVGMVSCAISGMLSLIQPLKWVAPLIPILPLKHFEFVESPVPLIAGLVIDAHAALSVTPSSILQLCKCVFIIIALFSLKYNNNYQTNLLLFVCVYHFFQRRGKWNSDSCIRCFRARDICCREQCFTSARCIDARYRGAFNATEGRTQRRRIRRSVSRDLEAQVHLCIKVAQSVQFFPGDTSCCLTTSTGTGTSISSVLV